MALQCDPPYLGDIGDDNEPLCNDPSHRDDCDCGATPDVYYESALDI